MKKTCSTICMLCLLFLTVSAQDTYNPIKWVIRPSYGQTFGVNKTNFGFITDNLTTYASQTFYWQVISSTYFFNNWGLEFSFMGNHNNQLNNRFEKFSNAVSKKYSDRYYITLRSGSEYSDFNIVGGSVERGSLGPVYKIEKNRTIFIFRALLGVTSFYTDWGSATLKEKGTNTILTLDWSADKVPKDFITLNPSFTVGYRFAKRFVIDLDINYWLYNLKFDYVETAKNLITDELASTTYHYKRLSNDLSFGIGFMIILK